MKTDDVLALGVVGLGIGGGAALAGKMYDAWPLTWNDFFEAVNRVALESQRKNNSEAFDAYVVNLARSNSHDCSPLCFQCGDTLWQIDRNLKLNLTPEEYFRIYQKLPRPQFLGTPILGLAISPVIEGPTHPSIRGSKKSKGGYKRKSNPALSRLHGIADAAPKLLSAGIPVENKHSNHKTHRQGRTTLNVRTRASLGLYDEKRNAGATDEQARVFATERLPLKKNLPQDEAVKRNRRAVDRAVRVHRRSGNWDYPKSDKSDANLK